MEILKQNEALEYVGGGKFTAGFAALVGAIGAFFLGLINGYANPTACPR